MSDLILGIDLGTTNSLIAHCDERGPRVLASPGGRRSLPSVVRLLAGGGLAVGEGGEGGEGEETVYSVKRLMGRSVGEVEGDLPHLAYRVVGREGDGRGMAVVEVGEGAGRRVYTPQEISAAILGELKGWAEGALGLAEGGVSKVVITVPAYFDDAQRQATRDAGAMAGLEVVRIVNEPTAAALAYGLDRTKDGTVAVYDLGGGTFDISILKIQDGLFKVLATHGDTHLGGDDIDRALVGVIAGKGGVEGTPALRRVAEGVKIALSGGAVATAVVPGGEGSAAVTVTVTREELLGVVEPLLGRTLASCRVAMRDANQPVIDRVIMVGGSTYIPRVREAVGAFFGAEAYTALDPMETVALGAAVQGAILARTNRDLLLQDILPLSLGIETLGGAVAKLLTKGRHIPAMAEEVFSTSVDGQTAIKIHVLQGERELVGDCRSLGEFTLGGVPPMPAGLPKVKVRFLVDASGILTVTAVEERSGTKSTLQVVPTHGLTRGEVAEMVRASVANAQADMAAHRLIDLRNQIAMDVRAIEKSLEIVGGEIDVAYRGEIRAAMERLEVVSRGGDGDAIHQALAALDKMTVPLAEKAVTKTLRMSAGKS